MFVCSLFETICFFISYVAVSLGSGAGSVIAVLQVIIASLTAYLATVTKAVSHLACATQTQADVSARWVPFHHLCGFKTLLHITVCLVFSFSDSRSLFLSLSLVLLPCFVEKRCWCQVRYLSGGFLLFWPLQPSRLYQLLLLRGDWPVSELQQAQGEGVFAFRARARLWMPLEMLCLQSFSGC